jgi:hypothetical protein
MEEADDICKISLVITDEKHIPPRQPGKMFGTADGYFIQDGKTRVRKQSHKKINDLPQWMKVSQPVNDGEAHNYNVLIRLKIRKDIEYVIFCAFRARKRPPEKGGQFISCKPLSMKSAETKIKQPC